jgi:hypothetical protein
MHLNVNRGALTAVGVLVGAFALSACSGPAEEAAPQATVTVTATPEPVVTAEPSDTSEPTGLTEPSEAESSPEPTAASTLSAAEFALSARGDLRDLLKDAGDAQDALDEGGTLRLVTNGGAMMFNVGQLQALEPPTQVAKDWTRGLDELDQDVQDYVDAVGGDSVSKIQKAINQIERSAVALQDIAESSAP